jgi:DNA transformation protein
VAVQPQYLEFVLEQLAALGSLRWRRMFGGIGLYSADLFFGLIDDDTLFFKTNESNAAEYQSRNMPRFMPPTDRPIGPFGYHQVPADVIEDAEILAEWARRAVAVALRSQVSKKSAGKKRARKKSAPVKKTRTARRR